MSNNMSLTAFCTALQDTGLATTIRENEWLFPTIETIHVFALVLVVGSIATVDLRLLGWLNRDKRFTDLAARTLPWTWLAFAVAAAAGLLMFVSKALTYYENVPFRIKMACMLFAGINMAQFHWLSRKQLASWDAGVPPTSAKLAGATSMTLWVLIVGAGRWIGFTT